MSDTFDDIGMIVDPDAGGIEALQNEMERVAREQHPPQNDQACQIDNCEFNGTADIWVAIRGALVYDDLAEITTHFNVWICHQHYERFSTAEPIT